ncbi:MAG: CpXC domain-containing protein [Anaerolineae bacterium]|nr:CpXC domain-containing protein [Anaerolineae bacterium]
MPPVKTQVNCPNCRQPVLAEIQQLFDVNVEPQAKQLLLSGGFNLANCPTCGFQGNMATPLVYHDPEKELLLTFFPPELNVSRDDQEKTIGGLITKVVDNLPQEQRKGYLFSPQASLTLQGFMERILEGEGITRDMIEAQQKRVDLIQELIGLSDDGVVKKAQEVDELIDAEFFTLLNRLAQGSAQAGDRAGYEKLVELQQKLLPVTTFGKELQQQSDALEAAATSLKEAGEGLTREKLLEIILQAPDDLHISALVSMARPGMDYEFFQLLTNRIDAAQGDDQQKMMTLRATLLELTGEIDKQIEARLALSKQNLDRLLEVDNIAQATMQNLAAIDEFFLQVLDTEFAAAKQANDQDRVGKLQQVIDVLQQAQQQAAGSGFDTAFLQELLEAPDEAAQEKILADRQADVTPEFVEALTGLLVQLEAGEDKATTEKVRSVYRASLRMSMQASMKKD